jgi:hypothetical protein
MVERTEPPLKSAPAVQRWHKASRWTGERLLFVAVGVVLCVYGILSVVLSLR